MRFDSAQRAISRLLSLAFFFSLECNSALAEDSLVKCFIESTVIATLPQAREAIFPNLLQVSLSHLCSLLRLYLLDCVVAMVVWFRWLYSPVYLFSNIIVCCSLFRVMLSRLPCQWPSQAGLGVGVKLLGLFFVLCSLFCVCYSCFLFTAGLSVSCWPVIWRFFLQCGYCNHGASHHAGNMTPLQGFFKTCFISPGWYRR